MDAQVADSACSATAYLSGAKSNYFTLGVNGHVQKDDCKAANNKANHVTSLLRWAQLAGKSTGIVTNTRITNATPAGAYAHSANRLHESDAEAQYLKQDPMECIDIAHQLVYSETGRELNVIFGGGTSKFLPNSTVDVFGKYGDRLDNRNLIDEWVDQKKNVSKTWSYINTRDELMKVDLKNTNFLMGLFASQHMTFHANANQSVEPSLYEMTEAAIKVLSQNPNGYVLFVEGGNIDSAHTKNYAQHALIETAVFHKTVEMADKATNESDTLIVVTSDHAHTMMFTGFSERGQNILGLIKNLNEGVFEGNKI